MDNFERLDSVIANLELMRGGVLFAKEIGNLDCLDDVATALELMTRELKAIAKAI